jgi:hypothetical protein
MFQTLPRILGDNINQLLLVTSTGRLNVNPAPLLALKPVFDNGGILRRVLEQQ